MISCNLMQERSSWSQDLFYFDEVSPRSYYEWVIVASPASIHLQIFMVREEKYGISVDKWELKRKIMMWVSKRKKKVFILPTYRQSILYLLTFPAQRGWRQVIEWNYIFHPWYGYGCFIYLWTNGLNQFWKSSTIKRSQVDGKLIRSSKVCTGCCIISQPARDKMKRTRNAGYWWGMSQITYPSTSPIVITIQLWKERGKKTRGWKDTQF